MTPSTTVTTPLMRCGSLIWRPILFLKPIGGPPLHLENPKLFKQSIGVLSFIYIGVDRRWPQILGAVWTLDVVTGGPVTNET